MCNHTAVAKAFVTAARALAFALLTIGTGINFSWAGSDQASGRNFTPISPVRGSFKLVQASCDPLGYRCAPSHPESCCTNRCFSPTQGCVCILQGFGCDDDPNCCSGIC